jgi:vacuolar-type H+-ATPase subunit I/STV1
MRKIITWVVTLALAMPTWADDYNKLTFEQNSGNKTSITSVGTVITFDGNTLTAVNGDEQYTLTLSELRKMFFTSGATGLLGDVLSYLRLYALGLAGAKLGEAFNTIGTQALGDGGAGWIFFILIVIVGHTLNLAMCVLGAFVHPLRLNFLEFFKNSGYEGTGRKYNPLTENINN